MYTQQFVGTVCHRYSAINVMFSVVLCSGFTGMHSTFILKKNPHQEVQAEIATALDREDLLKRGELRDAPERVYFVTK
jgi:hypothetical protein